MLFCSFWNSISPRGSQNSGLFLAQMYRFWKNHTWLLAEVWQRMEMQLIPEARSCPRKRWEGRDHEMWASVQPPRQKPSIGWALANVCDAWITLCQLRQGNHLLLQMRFTSDKMKMQSEEEALRQCTRITSAQLDRSRRMFSFVPLLVGVNEDVQLQQQPQKQMKAALML